MVGCDFLAAKQGGPDWESYTLFLVHSAPARPMTSNAYGGPYSIEMMPVRTFVLSFWLLPPLQKGLGSKLLRGSPPPGVTPPRSPFYIRR